MNGYFEGESIRKYNFRRQDCQILDEKKFLSKPNDNLFIRIDNDLR